MCSDHRIKEKKHHTKEKKMNFESHLFITDLLLLYLTPKTENSLIDPFFKAVHLFSPPQVVKSI